MTLMSTVLIIEDEAELVKILKIYLEKAGYSVFLAARGDDGLTLWEQSKPDLLIIDLNLPGVDGSGGHPDDPKEIRCSHHYVDSEGGRNGSTHRIGIGCG